ncbi:metallophosphoesterase [Sulfolobus sp. S-194]|uniref:metallophosphoesterase n=1 Tax=Sulfolobus sp. S-194 TaxID=2512240 RepID=UPI00143708FD|nr:metallophosphoesterase [Sulfolobus sp. S-194]QIW25352.1 metallophosphoesterase [Sulfolobus sp. S-194]
MISLVDDIYIDEDLPVIYIRRFDSIILSDVHIGYEEEMASKGIFIPKVQKKRFLNIFNRAREVFKTNKLIINGDLKHSFSKLTKQEKTELNEIFRILKDEGTEITIIRGNHDNYLSLVTENYDNIKLVESLIVDNIVIFHGHTNIDVDENKIYIIGHEHPRLGLRDKLGFVRRMQCFLVTPLKNNSKVIVLPAIGIYQAGNDISLNHSNYMSPLMREYSILEKSKPYVIIEKEGIMEFPELGLLKDIML